MRYKKYDRYELMAARETWSEPVTEYMAEDRQKMYRARRKAVDMYIDGENLDKISSMTGIDMSHVVKFVDRCLELDENGVFRGYTSLCPWKNSRSKGTGRDFRKLLDKHEGLKDFIEGNYFGYEEFTLEKCMSLTTLHEKFLKKCMDIGIGTDDYPFNTESQGYQSLRRYVKRLEESSVRLANRRTDHDAAQKAASTGYGENYSPLPVAPFACGQIDGHRIDMLYVASVELDDGTVIEDICERCWFLPIIDMATRCIVGYHMSQESNYNQFDLLKTFRNSSKPHEKTVFTIEGIDYPDKKGFPSECYPELEYALFDEIMLDNAKAHLAANVVNRVTENLGISLNYGSVATPETRGIVERFFKTIEIKGFHTLPGTTGSSSKSPKRNEPEKQTRKYRITFDDICQIMEILICQYNNSPHSGLLNRTPLEVMGERIKLGMTPHIATEEEKKAIEKMLYFSKEVTVRGNIRDGKRPYITYLGARYRGSILSVNYDFLGKKVILMINPDDISGIDAYSSDGNFIERLKAVGEYGCKKHSVKTRRLAQKYARRKKKGNSDFSTPLTDIEQSLKARAIKSRKARTRCDILRREQGGNVPAVSDDRERAEVVAISSKDQPQGICDTVITDMTSEETWLVMMNKKKSRRSL